MVKSETAVTQTLQLYQPLRSYFVISRQSTKSSGKARSFSFRFHHKSLFFSTNMLYKVLLALISTFREKNHYYQDYMTRFNNFSKELPVNFSKLLLLEMKICLVVDGENKKIKNQVASVFVIIFFSYFLISYFFEK